MDQEQFHKRAEAHESWLAKTGGYAKDLTLRDHFAAVALQGLLASETNASMEEFVAYSYGIADAMLEARNAAQ